MSLMGVVVIYLRATENVLPTNIRFVALESYHAPQEMKEHIFEDSLIKKHRRRIIYVPTLHIIFDVLSIEVNFRAIKSLGIAVMLQNVLLIRGVGNLCYLVIKKHRYSLALVLDGIALLDVYGKVFVLVVEASTCRVRQFWSVLVSVYDTFTVQDGCHVFIMSV